MLKEYFCICKRNVYSKYFMVGYPTCAVHRAPGIYYMFKWFQMIFFQSWFGYHKLINILEIFRLRELDCTKLPFWNGYDTGCPDIQMPPRFKWEKDTCPIECSLCLVIIFTSVPAEHPAYEEISWATTFYLPQHDKFGIYDPPKRVLYRLLENIFFHIFKILVW